MEEIPKEWTNIIHLSSELTLIYNYNDLDYIDYFLHMLWDWEMLKDAWGTRYIVPILSTSSNTNTDKKYADVQNNQFLGKNVYHVFLLFFGGGTRKSEPITSTFTSDLWLSKICRYAKFENTWWFFRKLWEI